MCARGIEKEKKQQQKRVRHTHTFLYMCGGFERGEMGKAYTAACISERVFLKNPHSKVVSLDFI